MTEIINVSFELPRREVFAVDSFADGISFGRQTLQKEEDARDRFGLKMAEQIEILKPRRRHAYNAQNPYAELEKQLMQLSKRGVLGSATIYFGTTTDPFLPFEGKFDASMKFLELFSRYRPGMLVVQTRSPLVVIAMPVLRKLGKHVAVTIGIETCDEESVRRYTPGLPRVEDRLKTARALRHFEIEVNMQVSPLLPYGDWREGAKKFADLLCFHGDHIHVKPLSDGTEEVERKVRQLEMAKLLARDRKFHWLRSDAANPLISQIEMIAPEKLKKPDRSHLHNRQMSIFAA